MEKNQISGLCSCCLNSPDCVFLENAVHPVLECGEFNPINKAESKKPGPAIRAKVAELPANEYTGLCRLCEKHDNCEYMKGRAVVWHCEEYE